MANLPVTLSVARTPFCAGAPLNGEVTLNFRRMQEDEIEEVQIMLTGEVKTYIQLRKRAARESTPLLQTGLVLWRRGAAYPPPGSDLLTIPFLFELPALLLPSFYYTGRGKKASVAYALTLTCIRPGTFQRNRRLSVPVFILPGNQLGARIRAVLGAGIEWKRRCAESKIRRGIFGSYSTVIVELSLPDIPALPLLTDIPYAIDVRTRTVPLVRSKADAHPADKPVFPAPPAMHTQLRFRLTRHVRIRAHSCNRVAEDDMVLFLGEGTNVNMLDVDTDLGEKEWVVTQSAGTGGAPEEVGVWVQHARFWSRMHLNVPPTFASSLVDCSYWLQLKVPFPGVGNDVEMAVPVTIVSGLEAGTPMPHEGQMLELPPAYWDEA